MMLSKKGVAVSAPRGSFVRAKMMDGIPMVSEAIMQKSRSRKDSRPESSSPQASLQEATVEVDVVDSLRLAGVTSCEDRENEDDVVPVRDLAREFESPKSAAVHVGHEERFVAGELEHDAAAVGAKAPARRVDRKEEAAKPGDVLVADVIGPEARSVDGDKFAVVVKDIASGVVMCEPLRNKSSILIMGTILMFQGWLRGGAAWELDSR